MLFILHVINIMSVTVHSYMRIRLYAWPNKMYYGDRSRSRSRHT